MSDPGDERDPLEVLAADFMDRQRRGQCPSVAEYAAAHPDLAAEIEELFPTIAAIERLKAEREGAGSGRRPLGTLQLERLGDFRILREIGRGGMGIVFEAHQESLGRHVAIKVLPKQSLLDPKQLRRFEREAQTAARLHHTNIVPVFGAGEQDGYHYIVMQLIDGVGLDAVLDGLRGIAFSPNACTLDPDLCPRDPNPRTFSPNACVGGDPNACVGDDSGAARPPRADTPASEEAVQLAKMLLTGRFAQVDSVPSQAAEASVAAPTPGETVPTQAFGPTETVPAPQADMPVQLSGPSIPTQAFGLSEVYWRSVATIGLQTAEGLQYAHAHQTLHRDIKPANLLVDRQGTVWISDFGLAKAMEQDRVTQSGAIVGTLRYMAPEQFSGQGDARSDVYSLGLTLYELLTLRPAFDDADRSSLIRKIAHGEPVRPRKLNPAIPRDLETIVLKAIAREPAHRYQSAAELAEDLQCFLEDRPIRARRASSAERLWRWARRNRAVASLSAAAIGLLLAITALACAGYVERTRALKVESQLRQAAETERQRAETNLRLAAEAFEDVFKRVAGPAPSGTLQQTQETTDETLAGPASQPVVSEREAAVLRGLLTFYDQFAEQNQGNLRWQEESARAFHRAAQIQLRLGKHDEAEKACRRAIAIYERLAGEKPADADCLAGLAGAHNLLAAIGMETFSREIDARQESKRAIDVLVGSPEVLAASPACRIELARAYNRYGLALAMPPPPRPGERRGPRPEDGEPCVRRAIEIVQALLKESPGSLDYRLTLAESHRHLWGLGMMRGRRELGAPSWKEAVRILEELVTEFPDEPECRLMLIETYLLPYRFRENVNVGDEPVRQVKRAVEVADGLFKRFPQVPKHRVALVQALWNAAGVLEENGHEAEAEPHRQRAIRNQTAIVDQYPTELRYRGDLAKYLGERALQVRALGRVAESQAMIEELIGVIQAAPAEVRKSPPWPFWLIDAYKNLAAVLKQRGQTDRAAQAEKKARELLKDLPPPDRRFPRPPGDHGPGDHGPPPPGPPPDGHERFGVR